MIRRLTAHRSKRRNVHELGYAGALRFANDVARPLDVDALEGRVRRRFLDDPDEVNDRITSVRRAVETGGIGHVTLEWVHVSRPRARIVFGVPGEQAYRMAARDESADNRGTDGARPTADEYVHPMPPSLSPVRAG